MFYTALFCTVLYCNVLYCTVLYCSVLYCNVLYCTVLYFTFMYCSVLFCNVLYCNVLFFTALFGTVLYCNDTNIGHKHYTYDKHVQIKFEHFPPYWEWMIKNYFYWNHFFYLLIVIYFRILHPAIACWFCKFQILPSVYTTYLHQGTCSMYCSSYMDPDPTLYFYGAQTIIISIFVATKWFSQRKMYLQKLVFNLLIVPIPGGTQNSDLWFLWIRIRQKHLDPTESAAWLHSMSTYMYVHGKIFSS